LLVIFFNLKTFETTKLGGKKKKNPVTNMGVDSLDHKYILKTSLFHTLALPFTLKSILRQKKNYENSNISPCKNIIFKKIL